MRSKVFIMSLLLTALLRAPSAAPSSLFSHAPAQEIAPVSNTTEDGVSIDSTQEPGSETPPEILNMQGNREEVPTHEAADSQEEQAAPSQDSEPAMDTLQAQVDALRIRASELPEDRELTEQLAVEAEQLADTLMAQVAFVEAKQCWNLSYELRKKYVGDEDFGLVPATIGHAKCDWNLELHEDAIAWYQHALAITDACKPESGDEKWSTKENILRGLVACYLYLQRPEEALGYSHQAYELATTAFGAMSSQALWSAAQLGETLRLGGMPEQAQTFNHKMFEICLSQSGGRQALCGLINKDDTQQQPPTPTVTNDPLPIRFWPTAPRKPEAILLCVHGMCLHSGGYQDFAKWMNRKGYFVVGVDVRGLGSWMSSQGQEYLNLDACIADITSVTAEMRQMFPDTPVFLIGESMGGGIVLQAAAENADNLAGVIASAPAAQRFKRGKETLRVVLQMTRGLDSHMDIAKDILPRATQNNELRQKWAGDPLARRFLSPRELISFQTFMSANAKRARSIRTLPVLVIQGMRDQLVKPRATEKLFASIASTDKTLIKLDDREHLTLELSQFTPQIIDMLIRWIDSHRSAAQAEMGVLYPSHSQFCPFETVHLPVGRLAS